MTNLQRCKNFDTWMRKMGNKYYSNPVKMTNAYAKILNAPEEPCQHHRVIRKPVNDGTGFYDYDEKICADCGKKIE